MGNGGHVSQVLESCQTTEGIPGDVGDLVAGEVPAERERQPARHQDCTASSIEMMPTLSVCICVCILCGFRSHVRCKLTVVGVTRGQGKVREQSRLAGFWTDICMARAPVSTSSLLQAILAHLHSRLTAVSERSQGQSMCMSRFVELTETEAWSCLQTLRRQAQSGLCK